MLKKIGTTLLVMLGLGLWIWVSESPKYSWSSGLKKVMGKNRFIQYQEFEAIDIAAPWTWINPPIDQINYLDKEEILSFAKDPTALGCLVGGVPCPAWTSYRILILRRTENGTTHFSESARIADCNTGEWGFYDEEQKRFRFVKHIPEFKGLKAERLPRNEMDAVCSRQGNLKNITLKRLEENLSTWKPVEKTISN
ncbi:MAG TPA: hypothetical protein V6C52_08420 [Coleofasciculaceae cyanobacterium]|jgi:hypothetical protein